MNEISTKVKEVELQEWKNRLLTYAKATAIYAFTGTLSKIEVECVREAFHTEIVYYPMLSKV